MSDPLYNVFVLEDDTWRLMAGKRTLADARTIEASLRKLALGKTIDDVKVERRDPIWDDVNAALAFRAGSAPVREP